LVRESRWMRASVDAGVSGRVYACDEQGDASYATCHDYQDLAAVIASIA